jgi:hypothetical protein
MLGEGRDGVVGSSAQMSIMSSTASGEMGAEGPPDVVHKHTEGKGKKRLSMSRKTVRTMWRER